MKYIKTFETHLKFKEEGELNIKYDNENLIIKYIKNSPSDIIIYVDTTDGESYIDISTNLRENPLIDAVWVEYSSTNLEIAKIMVDNNLIEETDRKTNSGYNNYLMFNVLF